MAQRSFIENFIREVINQELEGLVLESRMDDAKAKYPAISDTLDTFLDVPQKYMPWVAKQLSNAPNEASKLHDDILKFDLAVQSNTIEPKDIMAYKSIQDLSVALTKVGSS